MAPNSIGPHIEDLIAKSDWKEAQAAIEKQLANLPDDHWLWARLSGVEYEQRNYPQALQAAAKALGIVPDCPLALWSKANAMDMLGKVKGAYRLYSQLFSRAYQQLSNPDEDADECWEGSDWTTSLFADCVFRIAGCLARMGNRDKAATFYRHYVDLWDSGARGMYSREQALKRRNKLLPDRQAKREATVRAITAAMRRRKSSTSHTRGTAHVADVGSTRRK